MKRATAKPRSRRAPQAQGSNNPVARYLRLLVQYPHTPESNKAQLQFVVASVLFSVVFSAMAPMRMVSEHEWARTFCDFMASFIPMIDKVTIAVLNSPVDRSEENRFYFSVMWALSPIYVAFAWAELSAWKKQDSKLVQLNAEKIFAWLFLFGIAAIVFFVIPAVGKHGLYVSSWTNAFLSVAFFRGIGTIAAVAGVTMIFTMSVYFLREALSSEIRNRRLRRSQNHG